MNQPLTINENQVKSYPTPDQTEPPGDINPTLTTPGLSYSSMNPQINITLDQQATLTLIYVPVDRPNHPSNVETIIVTVVFPNGTISQPFTSEIPSQTKTTTPSGVTSETTTPSTTIVFPPSLNSPRVNLPSNFDLPPGTILAITISSTKDNNFPVEVGISFIYLSASE
jgi:hypothetical protein